jgi:hypothetical protein
MMASETSSFPGGSSLNRLSICTKRFPDTEDDLSEARRDAYTLVGGAVGLLAPVGFVKWLLRTDPEEAGILTLFFFPVWRLLVVLGLLIGRKAECS